jgi:ATP-dependent DNA helicase RecQ
VDELLPPGAVEAEARPARRASAPPAPVTVAAGPALDALKRWRLERSRADGVPAYVVFHDSTLAEIAGRRPRTRSDLSAIRGIGPSKLERYGDEVLAVMGAAAG